MSGGFVLSFATEGALRGAIDHLRREGVHGLQSFTPKIIENTPANSPLPLVMAIAGFIGVAAGFAMESYANVIGYPLDIGGRPKFSWPAFVPIAFEIGALATVLTGFVGFLIAARIPKLYDLIDEAQIMRRAMRDRWVLAVRIDDAEQLERVREVVQALAPQTVEELTA